MRGVAAVIALAVAVIACANSEQKEKPLSEPGEKLYTMRGRVVARDDGDNTLRVDHEPIPGFMDAMTMDYSVRGARVTALPPDGTRVEAKLHVTTSGYWLTDVKKAP